MDFNPVVDLIRVVTGAGLSFRVNANTGALVAQDTNLDTGTDIISDIAYSNNFVGATSTTLYAYNYSLDEIITVGSIGGTPNSPNTGITTVIGSTGIVANLASTGFDISGATGIGYLNVDTATANDDLYTVNLGTGLLTSVGAFGGEILDISVAPVAASVPEPGTLGLLGLGIVGGVAALRRKLK